MPGWRTHRKLVIISVDDYGNVRLDSRKARKKMDYAGIKVHSRFDAYDALETREDLESLYDVLTSVKDKVGNNAVFTPFSLPCNINFEKMLKENIKHYVYEQLPETYSKLSSRYPKSYEGAWKLWQEGIRQGLMIPQFHGREHLNVHVLNDLIKNKSQNLEFCFNLRSYVTIPEHKNYDSGWTAAFDTRSGEDLTSINSIVEEGLKLFEKVFDFKSISFTPPTQRFPSSDYNFLNSLGIEAIHRPFYEVNLEGKQKINWLKKESDCLTTIVRNIVFEPTEDLNFDSVGKALRQVSWAFKMKKPAHISSHRVNFVGQIDERNRKNGLYKLKSLLKKIVKRWPDVEFISGPQLVRELRK